MLNAFPVPNGPDFGNGMAQFAGTYSDSSDIDAISIRVDHILDQKLTLFGRYNYAPSLASNRQQFPAIQSIERTTGIVTLGATISLAARMVNDLRLNYSKDIPKARSKMDGYGGAIVPIDVVLFPAAFSADNTQSQIFLNFSGGTSTSAGAMQGHPVRQINVVNILTVLDGEHQFKLGVDYRRLAVRFEPTNFRNLRFQSEASVRNQRVSTFQVNAVAPGFPIYSNFSAFAQDTWRVTPRLMITYGLRWEVNPPPGTANGVLPRTLTQTSDPKNFALAPEGTSLYKTTYNNFAPRVGVAFVMNQRAGKETVLRGGFGVFYDLGNGLAHVGFSSQPFLVSVRRTNVAYPIDPAIDVLPPLGITLPIELVGVSPDLKLPYTNQWNLSVEQSMGASQSLTASYVAAVGRRLPQSRSYSSPNQTFSFVRITSNLATSDYHALQLQFNRRLSRGLQAMASYTWSHSLDQASNDISTTNVRANSDFDVRHNFSAGVTFDLPPPNEHRWVRALFGGWSLDSIIRALSAPPVDLSAGIFLEADGTQVNVRPDLIPGLPLYIEDSTVPSGKKLNNTIDPSRPNCKGPFCVPPAGRQGSLGRNVLRAYPLSQFDLALRRQFSIDERIRLQVRAEAFNIFNHPNFGPPNANVTSGLFGVSTAMLNSNLTTSFKGLSSIYNVGGPRSMQFALKLLF